MARGVQCISAVKDAYEDLHNSSSVEDVKAVKMKLASLQEVGRTLQKEAVRAKDVLEEKERELEQRLNKLTMKKTELENEVTRLIDDKASAEARCDTLNTQLSDKNKDYEEAQRELSAAQDRLRQLQRGPAMGPGSIIGAFYPAIPVESKITSAERTLHDRESDVERVKKDLSDTEISISKIQQMIDTIRSDISNHDSEINSTHDKMTGTKKSISIHLEAAHLWELFETAADNATGLTELLKDIVTKATKPEKMHILKSNGVVIKVKSFMEAWQEISMQGEILT